MNDDDGGGDTCSSHSHKSVSYYDVTETKEYERGEWIIKLTSKTRTRTRTRTNDESDRLANISDDSDCDDIEDPNEWQPTDHLPISHFITILPQYNTRKKTVPKKCPKNKKQPPHPNAKESPSSIPAACITTTNHTKGERPPKIATHTVIVEAADWQRGAAVFQQKKRILQQQQHQQISYSHPHQHNPLLHSSEPIPPPSQHNNNRNNHPSHDNPAIPIIHRNDTTPITATNTIINASTNHTSMTKRDVTKKNHPPHTNNNNTTNGTMATAHLTIPILSNSLPRSYLNPHPAEDNTNHPPTQTDNLIHPDHNHHLTIHNNHHTKNNNDGIILPVLLLV